MDPDSEYEPMYVGSGIDMFLIIFVVLGGILANWKFLKNMRDDDKNRGPNSNGILIRDVMETHSKIQMLYLPAQMIILWLFHENFEFPVWVYPSFCYAKFVTYAFRIYFAFNSLAVASMRYTFVVYQDGISSFGIEKGKKLFYYGSIITPLVIAIANECTSITPTDLRGRAYSMCIHSYRNSSNTTDFDDNVEQNLSSPIYFFLHQYISTNATYYIGILVRIFLWIIFANLVEGVLYWKTFNYINR